MTGWVWHLTPAGHALFGDTGPDPATWPQTVVKQNLQRTISRAVVGDAVVYVKRCRPNTPRSWLRELARGPKARLEFDNALALLARGIPTVEPLGWGRPAGRQPADSALLTRELAGEPLAELLARPLSPSERREWADRLACLFVILHQAGVAHPDPHPGNFLAAQDGTLQLIDVHDVELGRPLGERAEVANLVLLNRFFQMRASRTDRHRFWYLYRLSSGYERNSPKSRELARLIESKTADSNRRFWRARTKRHLGDNRDTHRVTGPAARGWAARDLPPDLIAAWLADPDAPFRQPGATILKDSRTSTVARVETPAGPVAYKRFNLKSPLLPLKALGRRPPAVRSWLAGHGLRDRGLPTARPLACFQRHRLGLTTVGYLVCEWVLDAVELPTAVARPELAWELGRLLRIMREREVWHRDLKASNVLVADGKPVLVDLVGVSFRRGWSSGPLVRLAASLPGVSNSDRLRVLLAYLGQREVAHNGWKAWWLALAAAVSARKP